MSQLSIAALSVAELSRFADPRQAEARPAEPSAAEKHESRQEAGPLSRSATIEGVGESVDISA